MDVIVNNNVSPVTVPVAAVAPSSSSSGTTSGKVANGNGVPASAIPPSSAARSLRVRTSSQSGKYNEFAVLNEIQLCPSVMSEDTRKMLPPTTETIQCKPFPIRGRWSQEEATTVLDYRAHVCGHRSRRRRQQVQIVRIVYEA